MVRRKGELNKGRIDREWPYQIALPIEAAGGRNTIIIQRFCHDLSICPRHKSYRVNGQEFIVHCFATRTDAEFFQTYFGGEFVDPAERARLPRGRG